MWLAYANLIVAALSCTLLGFGYGAYQAVVSHTVPTPPWLKPANHRRDDLNLDRYFYRSLLRMHSIAPLLEPTVHSAFIGHVAATHVVFVFLMTLIQLTLCLFTVI